MIFFCFVPGHIRDKKAIDYKINNPNNTNNQQVMKVIVNTLNRLIPTN